MPRHLRALAIIAQLFLIAASPMAAQAAEKISWRMAFLKGDLVKPAAQDLSKPIAMENGDAFRIYLQVVEPQAYAYVLIHGADGSILTVVKDLFAKGESMLAPSEKRPFTVTPPSGRETIYVIVSASRQAALEKLLSRKKPNADAVVEEIKRIQLSASSLAEAPQKPVPIGGAVRGESDPYQTTIFEGRETYVQILRLDH